MVRWSSGISEVQIIFIGCSFRRMKLLSGRGLQNTAFFNFINNIKVNLGACFSNNFTGRYINQRLIQHFIQQAAAPAEFFVQLIAAYAGKVITFVVKEGCFNKRGGVFQSRRFARAQFL